MNALQDCIATLQHIRQQISGVQIKAADGCQCGTQAEEVAASEVTMCGCGQDTCQIGDGPNACRPQQQLIAETEVL